MGRSDLAGFDDVVVLEEGDAGGGVGMEARVVVRGGWVKAALEDGEPVTSQVEVRSARKAVGVGVEGGTPLGIRRGVYPGTGIVCVVRTAFSALGDEHMGGGLMRVLRGRGERPDIAAGTVETGARQRCWPRSG